MRVSSVLSCALAALFVFSAPVVAQDGPEAPEKPQRPIVERGPVEMARHCVIHINAGTKHVIASNRATAHKSVKLMERLVEDEKPGAALAVGKRGIETITKRSKRAIGYINAVCDRCLERLEGHPVSAMVEEACEKAKDAIKATTGNLLEKIRDAAPERPETDPEPAE
ncbi:hypothetical protein [Mucisphaera calidilacus]|uniref:Uncharacterized protein n=1 Tax=Mucisphaera calidilacus TaxID=2527982 RepID=A0A518BUW3_9BACT|nr:hypothetical protein [Mucisphaera calidilacus]QDU70756.1 hypothetical protein Pan265_05910 [Mucisphaera calidilacus]